MLLYLSFVYRLLYFFILLGALIFNTRISIAKQPDDYFFSFLDIKHKQCLFNKLILRLAFLLLILLIACDEILFQNVKIINSYTILVPDNGRLPECSVPSGAL